MLRPLLSPQMSAGPRASAVETRRISPARRRTSGSTPALSTNASFSRRRQKALNAATSDAKPQEEGQQQPPVLSKPPPTAGARSAATARARRARRTTNVAAPTSKPKPTSSTSTTAPSSLVDVVERERQRDDLDPDLFSVDPEVVKLDRTDAGSSLSAAAAASGAVVVVSSSAAAEATTAAPSSPSSLLDSLSFSEIDERTDLIMSLATSGERFEQVLSEGLSKRIVDEALLVLLERRLAAARASTATAGGEGSISSSDGSGSYDSKEQQRKRGEERGLAVLWSRLKSEVERARAPPAERAIDDALRELESAGGAAEGRERAAKVLRRAAGLGGRSGSPARGSAGIDIIAVAAAAGERGDDEVDDDDESPLLSPSSSEIVPVAVLAATTSALLAAARRQAEEVERALAAARRGSVGGGSSPAFARAERLAADRRELASALQVILDVVTGL